ncbi:flavodoxin family protein [Candidatus Woesebacteria bacterium]|nr:flavodoxin family protein [Candidatus Woesebacteria bacterium]
MTNTSELPIHIIYASTSGNTEYVMDMVAQLWREKGKKVILHRSEKTDISVVKDNHNFLLATSTWDHGTINPFFDVLLAKINKTNLTGKKSAFIGLGDRRYEKHFFCSGMTLLKEVWEKNGGESTGVALTIGREPYDDAIAKLVSDWAETTLRLFDEN